MIQLLADFEIPGDDLTRAQRALLDAIAALTDGQRGLFCDSLAAHRRVHRLTGQWAAGGGVGYSLERRGLIQKGTITCPRARWERGAWNRRGDVYRLTPEGEVEQFAGAS